jgi:hypothetical protein
MRVVRDKEMIYRRIIGNKYNKSSYSTCIDVDRLYQYGISCLSSYPS